MPASKRWSGSAKKARETWLVAHMRRSASATKPWKAGAVCATSDRVGRKTASVSSENPPRTSTGTALLGIHLEIAEAAAGRVGGEAKELGGAGADPTPLRRRVRLPPRLSPGARAAEQASSASSGGMRCV